VIERCAGSIGASSHKLVDGGFMQSDAQGARQVKGDVCWRQPHGRAVRCAERTGRDVYMSLVISRVTFDQWLTNCADHF
jgi:hypothetical protein